MAGRLLGFVLSGASRLVRAWLGTRALHGEDRSRALGQRLRAYLQAMGPLYIKVGQVLATRGDLLSSAAVEELRQLQDDVPAMSRSDLDAILQGSFGSLDRVFRSFDFQPIASASIAQVHEARLHSGERVAVKVVKHGVRTQLRRNMAVVRALLRVVHLWPSLRHLRLPDRFREIEGLLLQQTHMLEEAANQTALSHALENHPYVRIPRAYHSHTSDDVLVMDFVDAIRGKDFRQVQLKRSHLARRLQDTVYTLLYLEGLCHADPHLGNLFFTPEGEIILVDFGLIAQLDEDEKWALASFYYACTRSEWAVAVQRLSKAFIRRRGRIDEDFDGFVAAMTKVLRRHFEERADHWSTYEFFHDASVVLRRYGADYTTSFTKIELIFVSCEGTANQIDPEIDIWDNARKFNDRFSPYMSPRVRATFDEYFALRIPQSKSWQERAHRSLIAPTHLDRYFLPSAYPLFVRRCHGAILEDVDGNEYVDLSCGYGPHILGYAHPVVSGAIQEALRSGWVNAMGHAAEVELAEKLVAAFPGCERAVFSNSGTEAVLQAIRICRAHRRRDRVAKFEGHYHGFSDIGLVSSWFRYTGPREQPLPSAGTLGCADATVKDTLILQYGDPRQIDRLREHAEQLACVIVEPMPSVMADYDLDFLAKLAEACRSLGVPLIFDEVVSGFRVTYGGVQKFAGVAPDLTCLGKIIGGGLPCGAVVGRGDLMEIVRTTNDPFLDCESRAFVGGTMSGNSLSCAAGLAAISHLEAHPEIYSGLERKTQRLASSMRESSERHRVPFQLKAKHSIFAMTFSHKRSRLARDKLATNFKANLALAYYMRKHGVYMPELHTIMLNAAHTDDDLDRIAAAFDASLGTLVDEGFFVS